mmetsp:Transcript_10325/g.10310  ORF Transcript_10325/g.10310 Transcript_10325/m.10310 type:complete len:150 (+) Transcript_10325:320-769(+)
MIYGVQWQQVDTFGEGPGKISHHQGVLASDMNLFIMYGGYNGSEVNDSIFTLELKRMKWSHIPAAQQKGAELPGPRDDFLMVSTAAEEGVFQPIYLIGGFKNGIKMNDLFRLSTKDGRGFEWEKLEVQGNLPEGRSGFHGASFRVHNQD